MAWSFVDNWQPYSNNDTRSCRIWLNQLGGTNYIDSTTFDYFSDSAQVDDYILFAFGMKFWGIRLNVVTAFVADSVSFVWEYWDGSTWATLPVLNGDAMLSTGQQDITFTPPADWSVHSTLDGWAIRCRIDAVSNITEGGSNGTSKVYWNFKRVEGTGTISGLNSLKDADLAGNYTILPATIPATGLVPLEMTVNALEAAEQVDVILSGTSAGAGDTVVLTGIDFLGNNLVETIDVSSGDGTYISNNAFKNITDISCNGFSDGTIQVNQKRWGVIDKKSSLCRMNCHFCIGDGSTSTTVTINNHYLDFIAGYFWQIDEGMLQAGTTSGSGDYEGSVNGCILKLTSAGVGYFNFGNMMTSNSVLDLKGSEIIGVPFLVMYYKGTLSFQDTTINQGSYGRTYISQPSSLTVKRAFMNRLYLNLPNGINTLVGLVTPDTMQTYNRVVQQPIFQECSFSWANIFYMQGTGTAFVFLDCEGMSSSNIGLYYLNTSSDSYGYIKFSFDLTVIDSSGNIISGAEVSIKDIDGTEVFSGTTDANGQVSTELSYQVAHNDHGSASWSTKTPHTVTISKDGYQTKTIKYTMDRKREEVEVLEPAVKLLMPMGKKVYKNLKPSDGQNKVLWEEV